MRDLSVQVDTHLRFDPHAYDGKDWETILGHLVLAGAVVDPDDENAEPITLLGMDSDGRLTMPRGFALKLKNGMASAGFNVVWDDRRVSQIPVPRSARLELRPYQRKALGRLMAAQQGIYEAPPGSGKTVTGSYLIDAVGQRSLVIVDKINIVTQWREEYEMVTGREAGQIGDGVRDERYVTMTTRQGLWAMREELDESEWWKQWGLVLLDECHGISSLTTRELIQRFPAFYRIGLSATPDRADYLTHVSRSIIGEIVCRTSYAELEKAGVLVMPRIVAVKTPFEYPWKARLNANSQWQSMLKALKEDSARNKLFAELAGKQRGHTCIVITDHKKHAYDLAGYAAAAGWPDDRILMLTGDQNDAERTRVKDEGAKGDCIIFSTIGQEALNIPRLSRLFLVFPTKQDYSIRQIAGRVMRTHETKVEAPIVFDFYDWKVGVLTKHFGQRRGAYDRQGFNVSILDPSA